MDTRNQQVSDEKHLRDPRYSPVHQPAFPSTVIREPSEAGEPPGQIDFCGLTKREFFASTLMAALMQANTTLNREVGLYRDLADEAVEAAEALCQRLDRRAGI